MRLIHYFSNSKKNIYFFMFNFFQLVSPVVVVFLIYFLHVYNSGYGENLYNTFLERTALTKNINENFFLSLSNNFFIFFIK